MDIFRTLCGFVGFLVCVAVTAYTWGAFVTIAKNDFNKQEEST